MITGHEQTFVCERCKYETSRPIKKCPVCKGQTITKIDKVVTK